MRALTERALLGVAASADQPWMPGLPHAVAGLASALVFGLPACLTGLILAALASFVVYLPVTALALNGGRAIEADAAAPAMPTGARVLLLGLWTATVWGAAALAG
jgi:hypothetical protein